MRDNKALFQNPHDSKLQWKEPEDWRSKEKMVGIFVHPETWDIGDIL